MNFFRLTFILTLLSCSFLSNGQNSVFIKHYDSPSQTSRTINKTKDGNYITASTRLDINIAKLNSNGDTLWTKRYDPQQGINCEEIKPHFDSGYILAGTKRNSSTNVNEGFIAKIDSIGNTIWAKTLNLSGIETYIFGMDVGQDSSIIVSGHYISGNKIGFVSKISATGNLVWTQRSNNLSGNTRFYEVEYDYNGDIIAVGDDSNIGTIVEKLTPSGNVIWSKISNLGANCKGLSVEILPSGNLLVAGRPRTGIGSYDFYLHKINPSGNLIFSKTYGNGDVTEMEEMELNNNNLSVFGKVRINNSDYQAMLSQIDSLGNINYSFGYGNSSLNELGYGGTIGHDNSNWIVVKQDSPPTMAMMVKTDSMGYIGCYTDTINLLSINTSVIYTNGPTMTSTTPSYQNFTWNTIQGVYRDSVFCSNTICNLSATANVTSNYNGADITCNGASDGQATVSVVNGSGLQTYNWSTSGNSVTETGMPAGNHYCIVTDGSCIDTAYVTIVSPTIVSANITASNNPNCFNANDGDATVSAGGGTPGYTYSWSPSGGNGATGNSLSGGVLYTVTVSDLNGCQATDTITLANPSPLMVSATGAATICEGQSTSLSATGAINYSWNNGAGNGSTVSVSPSNTTTYIVTGTDANNCQDTAHVTVTVNPLPNVSIQVYSPDTICNTQAPLTLPNGTPTGGTYSGVGVIGGNFDPNIVGIGTHYTVYTYTDGNSCTNTDSTSITVKNCVGIEDIYSKSHNTNIAPNPNNGRFLITNKLSSIKDVEIYNLIGKVVYTQKNIFSSQVIINEKTSLPPGTYLLKITDQELNTHTKKVLIK
jgi:hypothetical protein